MSVLPLPLLAWLSPGFPVGAFAYSHGLEWAVECGAVASASDLREWLADLLSHGSLRADAALLASAWRAAESGSADLGEACLVNDLALALAPSQERRLETGAQGTAFLEAVRSAWPSFRLDEFAAALIDGEAAYPVAVGVTAAAHALALRPTLDAFTFAACANLVSAALRLSVIGQSEAQAVLAALCPAMEQLAGWATTATPDDCGTASWRTDIASMRHETQYSRLFRS